MLLCFHSSFLILIRSYLLGEAADQKYIRCSVLGCTRKIDSNISPIHPLNFTGEGHVRNVAFIFDPSRLSRALVSKRSHVSDPRWERW